MKAKQIFPALAMSILASTSFGQVAKTVLAEHFTNTYCSICAAKNPGLFTNLWNYPQVLHLSYYPSAPYAACPFSKYNKAEQDARTNFFGIYGGTPQLVIGGDIITTTFNDPVLYTSRLGNTTPFEVRVTSVPDGVDSMLVQVVVKKVAPSSLTAAELYGAVAEDTLFFTANNGEIRHYDVFRKSLWGTTSLTLTVPAAVGDSVIYAKKIAIDPTWTRRRVYALAVLQQTDKQVVQAARSANMPGGTAGLQTVAGSTTIKIYPNPATDKLCIDGVTGMQQLVIIDTRGVEVQRTTVNNNTSFVNISALTSGTYKVVLNTDAGIQQVSFIKR